MRNLTFVFFAVGMAVFLCVEGRSPVQCPLECGEAECAAVNCRCGTFKDECNCCDLCLKCPGENCSLLRGELCSDGFTCFHPEGTSFVHRINNDGRCVRKYDAPA